MAPELCAAFSSPRWVISLARPDRPGSPAGAVPFLSFPPVKPDRAIPYDPPMRDPRDWLGPLEPLAPDLVAPFRALADDRPLAVRREVRRLAGEGSVGRLLPQHEAIADAFEACLRSLPDAAFSMPGGEADWTVAEALGHAFESRQGLALAAALAASGRWPADVPAVVPGVPGSADAGRDDLLRRLARSRRHLERASRSIAGHELDPCPLEHPLVGRLRCGEWFLFAGVHDLMHLEQLAALDAWLDDGPVGGREIEPAVAPGGRDDR